MSPPVGAAPKPIPCDDFLPTNFTGNSLPKGSGPARRAAAETENSLKTMKNVSINVLNRNTECVLFLIPVGCKRLEVNDAGLWIP